MLHKPFRRNRLAIVLAAATVAGRAAICGATTGIWENTSGGSWTDPGNWLSGTIPNGDGDEAVFLNTALAPADITLDGLTTIGDFEFQDYQPYTISAGSGGSLVLSNGGEAPEIYSTGNDVISAPISLPVPAGVNIYLDGPSTSLAINGDISGVGAVTENYTGTLTVGGNNTYGGGTDVFGGLLYITAASAVPVNSFLSITSKAQLASGIGGITLSKLTDFGTFDIGNNHVIVSSSGDSAAAIRGYLVSGYNGGNWNGAGIDTSAVTGSKYGLGYADGADGGISGITSGQIEVKYTLYGDTNLDGSVNSVDFGNLAANFGKSGKVWDQGDFDYNGTVNSVDFGLLAGNFGKSLGAAGAVASADWAALDAFATANGLMSEVPEPTAAGMLLATTAGICLRRRRKTRSFAAW
jgi:hypothetical protein